MSLSKLATSNVSHKVATLTLLHPGTGEELTTSTGQPMQIDLVSIDSEDYKRAFQRTQNVRLRKAAAGGVHRPRIEDALMDQVEVLVACTKGWRGLEEDEGEIAFNPEAAKAVYEKYAWIREQASSFQANRANFLGNC